jgi:hypothetical protein
MISPDGMTYDLWIYKSVDGGNSWNWSTLISTSQWIGTGDSSLAVSPNFANDQTIFAGWNGSGVFRSTNGGNTWSSTGFNAAFKTMVISPDFANDHTIFAGVYVGGVYKSIDGGSTWTSANSGISAYTVQSLAVSPNYAVDKLLVAGTTANGVFKSTDGGITWTAFNAGLGNLDVSALSFPQIANQVLSGAVAYAGTAAGAYKIAMSPLIPVSVSSTGTGSGCITLSTGGGCVSSYAGSFTSGTVLTITPTANAGSTFVGWQGCDSVSGNVCTVNMAGSKNVTATFSIPTSTLVVVAGGTGSGTVSYSTGGSCTTACASQVSTGTTLQLTAVPGIGSSFAGWSGCDSVNGTVCTVTMTAAKSVMPIFTLDNQNGSDTSTWATRTSGTVNWLYSIAYVHGIFVATGDNGSLLTSPDGVTWTTQTSGTTVNLRGTTYANGKFVTVGFGGSQEIFTSSDGVTWTGGSSAVHFGRTDIAYGNGVFVTVGFGGVIETSPNGVTWTNRPSGTSNYLARIIYANGGFVAVGNSGTIMTSPNGTDWTSQNSGVTNDLYGVTFGNGTFVAVGQANVNDLPSFNGVILTSPNGVTWTRQPISGDGYLSNVTFGNGIFATVSEGGITETSIDGTSWTSRTTTPLKGITFGNGSFVAVGANGVILQSQAGTPPSTTMTATPTIQATSSSGSFTLTTSQPGGTFLCSLDGSAWTTCTSPFNFSGLADGNHILSVKAVGPTGAVSTTPATYTWNVDSHAILTGGNYFTTIATALTSALDGSAVTLKNRNFYETVAYNFAKLTTLSGGYGPNFELPLAGAASTIASLDISSGTVNVMGLIIAP